MHFRMDFNLLKYFLESTRTYAEGITFLEESDVVALLHKGIDEERGVISEKFARLLDEQPGSNDRAEREKGGEGE